MVNTQWLHLGLGGAEARLRGGPLQMFFVISKPC